MTEKSASTEIGLASRVPVTLLPSVVAAAMASRPVPSAVLASVKSAPPSSRVSPV